MAKNVSIYALKCPQSGEIRYIGKANDPQKRLKSHLRDARRRDTPVYRWMRKLSTKGLVPELAVLEVATRASWPEAERRQISAHRVGGRLLNVAAGGDEPACPKSVRAANGRANAARIHGDPVLRRVWEVKQMMGDALKRGYASDSLKAKLRKAAQRHPGVFGCWANV